MTRRNLVHSLVIPDSLLAKEAADIPGLIRRGDAMMSINAFTNWIGAPLSRSVFRAKTLRRATKAPVALVATIIALGTPPAIAQDREQVRVVFEHTLPNVDGKRMVAVTVSYPPGSKSLPHHHAASAFNYAYVLSGVVRSQVGNEPAKVDHAGEGFYETPGSHHGISENASETEPPACWQSSSSIPGTRP